MARSPYKTVVLTAAVALALLLVLPPVPPQAAIYVALVVIVLGVTVPFAYYNAKDTLSPLFEDDSPDSPEPTGPVEQAKEAYVTGEISEQEFEQRLDAELGDEQATDVELPDRSDAEHEQSTE